MILILAINLVTIFFLAGRGEITSNLLIIFITLSFLPRQLRPLEEKSSSLIRLDSGALLFILLISVIGLGSHLTFLSTVVSFLIIVLALSIGTTLLMTTFIKFWKK